MIPTPEQVQSWAREADCLHVNLTGDRAMALERLQRFGSLACAWQRERDAKTVEAAKVGLRSYFEIDERLSDAAEAIRSDCAEPGKAG